MTLLHHGHIRLLQKASEMGWVVAALTTDDEIRKHKGYDPELTYESRYEILSAVRYVDEIVALDQYLIDDAYLDLHRIDFLVHGDDNPNPVSQSRLRILSRTSDISSTLIRQRVLHAVSQILAADDGRSSWKT